MTFQEQKAIAAEAQEVWAGLMPDLPAPPESQFLVWAGWHTADTIHIGLNRAAAKRLQLRDSETPMTTDSVVRYASGVMKNIRNQTKAPWEQSQAATLVEPKDEPRRAA